MGPLVQSLHNEGNGGISSSVPESRCDDRIPQGATILVSDRHERDPRRPGRVRRCERRTNLDARRREAAQVRSRDDGDPIRPVDRDLICDRRPGASTVVDVEALPRKQVLRRQERQRLHRSCGRKPGVVKVDVEERRSPAAVRGVEKNSELEVPVFGAADGLWEAVRFPVAPGGAGGRRRSGSG